MVVLNVGTFCYTTSYMYWCGGIFVELSGRAIVACLLWGYYSLQHAKCGPFHTPNGCG